MDTKTSRPTFIAPPPPTSSPPNDEEFEVQVVSTQYVSNIPRRLPTTTLIPSPMGVYPLRLAEDDLPKDDGPILSIDAQSITKTPDENVPPSILLRKEHEISDYLCQSDIKFNFFDSKLVSTNLLPKKSKGTAHLIIKQPSEPPCQTHRRSKSRDAIMNVLPRKRTSLEIGAESVKTTRSLKITYRGDDFTPEIKKKQHHKKSSSGKTY